MKVVKILAVCVLALADIFGLCLFASEDTGISKYVLAGVLIVLNVVCLWHTDHRKHK